MRPLTFACLVALTTCLSSLNASFAQAAEQGPGTSVPAEKVDAFGERVRAYLLANPEVIVEAIQLYQQRQEAQQAETVRQTITAKADQILRDPAAPTAGNAAGDVTLVEFFDYNCKYCRAVAPTIDEVLAADPGLRLVYKEFPILGDGSEAAARVALAAARQGPAKYKAVHHALMRAAGSLTETTAVEAAVAVGVDEGRLRLDMGDPELDAVIARNRALAADLGITGTPGFVIGGEIVPGAIDRATLEGLVAKARGSKGASP